MLTAAAKASARPFPPPHAQPTQARRAPRCPSSRRRPSPCRPRAQAASPPPAKPPGRQPQMAHGRRPTTDGDSNGRAVVAQGVKCRPLRTDAQGSARPVRAWCAAEALQLTDCDCKCQTRLSTDCKARSTKLDVRDRTPSKLASYLMRSEEDDLAQRPRYRSQAHSLRRTAVINSPASQRSDRWPVRSFLL
eukprot:6211095-Pleurochrysis_carterae.AAC.1